MAVYVYKALNAQGKQIRGMVDAESVRAARQKLKSEGIFPTSVVESRKARDATRSITLSSLQSSASGGTSGGKRINPALLGVATRQLATLSAAGMPLVEALKALGDQIDNPRLKSIIAEVADRVNEGSSLAEALRAHGRVFPKLYINMVASGEASGSLDIVLERLADLLEAQAALRRKVVAALAYPVLMLLLCFGVILLLLAYVVPQITVIFQDQGATLPLPTQIVIVLSDFVRSFWFLIVGGAVAAVILFRRYSQTPKGRKKLDQILLNLPFAGPVALKVATSRLARNLGTMLASGVELLAALGIARNIIGNVVLEEIIDSAIVGVREGKGLSNELAKAQLFPRLLIHMIAIGEKTGKLDVMLLRAANSYEGELNALIAGLTSILEPLLILFLAVIVGAILASVMLPMLEMTALAGA